MNSLHLCVPIWGANRSHGQSFGAHILFSSVETIQGLPQHHQLFSYCCYNSYYNFLTIQFNLWPLFLFASFLCSTSLRVYIGVSNFDLVWINSNWYVKVQQAHGSFHVTYLWIEIVCYKWCCVYLYFLFAMLWRMQPLVRSFLSPYFIFVHAWVPSCSCSLLLLIICYHLRACVWSFCQMLFVNVFWSLGQ